MNFCIKILDDTSNFNWENRTPEEWILQAPKRHEKVAWCLGIHTKENYLDPTEDTTFSHHCLLRLLLAVTASLTFLVFDAFTFWVRHFVGSFSVWLSFLIIRIWGFKILTDFERKTIEVKVLITLSYQGCLVSVWLVTIEVSLHHLAEIVFVRLLACKVMSPSFLWKEATVCTSYSRNRVTASLKADYVSKLFGILLYRFITLP